MDNGWIKLHRKALENDIIRDQNAWCIFTWLLLKVDRLTGQKKVARSWACEELGMKATTFYDSLMRLVKKYKVATTNPTGTYTTVTLLNWDKYQSQEDNPTGIPTATRQQPDTLQEERSKNIYNNDKLPEDGSDLEKLLVEGNNKGITKEFQYFGIEMWKQLKAPFEKKSECIRIAKVYPRVMVEAAYSFALDYPKQELKWKMFIWKLNQIRKEKHDTTPSNAV